MADAIQFYEPNERYGFFSNFSLHSIVIDGTTWPTVEHYYQASKFLAADIIARVHHATTPEQAFKISREYSKQVRPDWNSIKEAVMMRGLRCKFHQHHPLAHWLVATETQPIVEHCYSDAYWGDGGDGSGQNRLGQLLMALRDELKNKHPYKMIRYVDAAQLPTQFGVFTMHGFVQPDNNTEHLALTYGELDVTKPVLIRLHSECLTGDALYSLRCDCGFQLQKALETIVSHGSGALLYLRQEGRGIGLLNKIRAYHLQDKGADTVEANERLGFAADMREYHFCEGMLHYLEIDQVKLMTNNPRKVQALCIAGINVVERVPLQEGHNIYNDNYLATKSSKLRHILSKEDGFSLS
ncbi:GTP cyclohydrolase II [Spartinivicinus poritis]|uniref:GTP cyclohydrolase-2 n=1 Tax=Spartinivicinus poritis TaxID=2994640 RepID=A0ABT5U5V3_9GAMM|nr:GTP cyclohydrolase II [Spartinivicinus sp. A2-2]MDE1461565.1 GTP cyclohydrolase II [Spartinivicinus sp. A2-2]